MHRTLRLHFPFMMINYCGLKAQGSASDPKAFLNKLEETCQTQLLHTGARPWTLSRSFHGLRMRSTLKAEAETEGVTQGRSNNQQS